MDRSDGHTGSGSGLKRPGRWLALTVGATLMTATVAAVPALSSPAGAATTTSVLSLDVLPGLALLAPAAVPSTTVLHIGVAMTEPNAAAENSYETALYNPESASYHHFLTPAQFAADYGVAPATTKAVQTW
jgi:subtilase family serine protease